jgi:hypothetical protein
MPDATYHALIVAPYGPDPQAKTHSALSRFDEVKYVLPEDQVGYLHFNALRYSLLKRFGLDECLYVDPDVDIFASMEDIPDQSQADILWCRSPVEPAGMGALLKRLRIDGKLTEGDGKEIWPNSGMLYLRKDYLELYWAAAQEVLKTGYDPRMIGNAAFMVMCRMMDPSKHAEMPYSNDVIWWEEHNPVTRVANSNGLHTTAFAIARAVHYCNDQGKAKRREIDELWVYND